MKTDTDLPKEGALSDQLDALKKKEYNATVIHIQEITPDLRIFRVRADSGDLPFEPGVFTSLGLLSTEAGVVPCELENPEPKDWKVLKRAYSISHPVLHPKKSGLYDQSEFLEFYITLVREKAPGQKPPALTPRLFALKEGARIFLGKLTGNYVIPQEEIQEKRHFLFFATGTGEAPHNAMIWKLLRAGYQGRLTAVVCVRKRSDLGYKPLYEKLTAQFPQLTYLTLVTQEADTPKRYIQDIIENGELEKLTGEKLSAERHAVYLCGNPQMIGIPKTDPTGKLIFPAGRPGMIELFTKLGFKMEKPPREKGNIHYEKFW